LDKAAAVDTPVDLEILFIRHLWHNSNARQECSRVGYAYGRNEL